MNINRWTRGITVIPNKIVFAGGYPKFRVIPKVVTWGGNVSIFWFGTELVWLM